jgi:hypothetical protein
MNTFAIPKTAVLPGVEAVGWVVARRLGSGTVE